MSWEWQQGSMQGLSRRDFLQKGVKVGAAVLLAGPLAAACGGTSPASTSKGAPSGGGAPAPAAGGGSPVTIKFGDIYTADSHLGKGVDRFAQLAKQLTNGKVDVQVFHNGSLGSERDEATQVRTGTIQMMETGLAGIGTYVPDIQVMELPYLYTSFDQIKQTLGGVKDDIQKLLLDKGVRSLGFFFDGPRETISVKPLRSLADFKGLKFRVPDSPAYVGMAKALGSNPTPTAFSEVYTDLQTHVVDAAEGSPDSLFTEKWYEVAKYITLTDHIYQVLYLIINEKFFQGLDHATQQALEKAGSQASDYQFTLVTQLRSQRLDQMKAAGDTVIEVTDKKPFVEACRSFDDSFAAKLGPQAEALYKRVRAATGA